MREKNPQSDPRAGQSLLEVLIATVVGSVMILAVITLIGPALKSNTDVVKIQTGSALGKAMQDQVRVFSEADWHNIQSLATTSANPYYLAIGGSPFVAVTGTETVIPDVQSGLAGYWKLDEAAGANAYDSSGNGNTAAWVSSPVATSSCAIGNCLYMSSGYLNVGTSTSANLTGDMTLAAWIKITAGTFPNGGTNWEILSNEAFQASGFVLRVDGATTKIYFRTSQAGTYTDKYGNAVLQKNAWYHVVVTRSGTATTFYINGAPDATGSTNNPVSATNSLHISNNSQGMDGYLDDVRMYNRALSASEVAQLYKATVYKRYFFVDDVLRDVSGYIQDAGTTPDPSTKKITVVYGATGSATNTITSYVSRSIRDNITWQSDWSGGSGMNGPATSTSSGFATSSGVDVSSAGTTFISGLAAFVPIALTIGTSSLSTSTVILSGTVNPYGSSGYGWFEYGTSTSFGMTTASTSVGSGMAAVTVTSSITGLTPNTTYYFRMDGSNTAGTSQGSTLNFKTYVTYIDYLVVGGGGGGGNGPYGGGGGGGDVVVGSQYVTSGGISVAIGSGGPAASVGNQSTLGSITASGGGSGGTAGAGGSGANGGGGSRNAAGGTGNAGFNGGAGHDGQNGDGDGGGGGGDTANGNPGDNAVGYSGGNGGGGRANSYSGSSVVYGSGGGGGTAAYVGVSSGGTNAGSGGAPDGAKNGGNATANKGGGGGGAAVQYIPATGSGTGGSGGSGIVIVRYPGSFVATGGTTSTNGGYSIHTFTSGGTLTF